jgi:hypothetical protein
MVTSWIRFRHQDKVGFGTLLDGEISVHTGDMFGVSQASGERCALSEVEVLAPSQPSKIIALWNNFHALAAKLNVPEPKEPLYLLKAPTTAAAANSIVTRPPSYDGKVVYEGELGIVIGRTCSRVSAEQADGFIHGYTCVNDITAGDIIGKDATFAQWARAKGFDNFCPFGPGNRRRDRSGKAFGAYRIKRRRAPELSDLGHDLQRATACQQDIPRHDAVSGRFDLLRDLARRRRHEGSNQQGYGCDRRRRRAAQRISSMRAGR